ncbi:expressed unknown protein [Seminavis robusta]|uniref:DUF1995 domain-containing protein n=1 Tax=Seminavis robusta TaxID=568900 RepID=A0A9N8DDM8_9STRA|nr:expressed unknown protein [Seminavis robusta]|eukprot:Sro70_g039190.1 n/a (593) ;mRNA; r:127920-129782
MMAVTPKVNLRGNLATSGLLFCVTLVLLAGTALAFSAVERVGLIPSSKGPATAACGFQRQQRCLFNPLSSATKLNLSRGGPPFRSQDGRDDDYRRGNKNGKEDRRSASRSSMGQGFGGVFRGRASNSTTGGSAAIFMDPPETHNEVTEEQMEEMTERMTQLESLVAKQSVEIRRLKDECSSLQDATKSFHQVIELLRAAGLQTDESPASASKPSLTAEDTAAMSSTRIRGNNNDIDDENVFSEDGMDNSEAIIYEYFDDAEIFGEAPSSVTDAADHAGAAILAGLLGGKQRMLVDVRDSELSLDPGTLVQFIELAILPVAAGLEGLLSKRNRVKIVFPTVSQLLQYRKTMALAAPEVVALSTLGFDPVEEGDNIVVIVAPSPDDEEGLQVMNDLLDPPDWKQEQRITQPVVVLNPHMAPLTGPAASFDAMYHLRLLSVQYMSGNHADSHFESFNDDEARDTDQASKETKKPDDALLEQAMRRAHEAGVNHGVTRAMVVRAYPKPWHVFVDISPDTDADFVVAATFDEEPTVDEVNMSIVECIEGSESEDEIVAQQMQQAFESQNEKLEVDMKEDDEDDEEDDWYNQWTEDSI